MIRTEPGFGGRSAFRLGDVNGVPTSGCVARRAGPEGGECSSGLIKAGADRRVLVEQKMGRRSKETRYQVLDAGVGVGEQSRS